MNARAGQVAASEDLINVDELLADYTRLVPDADVPGQEVVFGTSGHRGSSSKTSFNEAHIKAITQAIVEHREREGIHGPIFVGSDTHALSGPAERTAVEVLLANGCRVMLDSRDSWVPTPALSHAIIRYNEHATDDIADGIVITPSHNPPSDGGFKYNPPNGGPADSAATTWIAARANDILRGGLAEVKQGVPEGAAPEAYDYRKHYVEDLRSIIDVEAIRDAGIRIGAHPLGGASVDYWAEIARVYDLDLTVIDDTVDPQWAFMTLDWDGKIRMDPSSPNAMAVVAPLAGDYDIVTGNDADADRHGIVTPDAGLMNPNHYLAVAIDYLCRNRDWGPEVGIGKTLVSSSIIDRVVESLGRELVEVPVGFKWFVDGLTNGRIAFGGEESAGASFLRFDGRVWTTDKDGILLALLASEIRAVTGRSPSQLYAELTKRFGDPVYQRVDAPATPAEKARLGRLSADDVRAERLAGDGVRSVLTEAPGNGAPLGGVKVTTDRAWFAARPSGTEDVYKIYAESFGGPEHLAEVQREAKAIVDAALRDA